MARILGIDPGSRATGFGLLETASARPAVLASGVLRPAAGLALPDRLLVIHRGVRAWIGEHRPDLLAVETAFYSKNARSALVLGHVRGVVLLAAREADLPIHEYAPREIKLALTGNGGAAKEQVAFMVRGLLQLGPSQSLDETDALAAAVCHWHRSRLTVLR